MVVRTLIPHCDRRIILTLATVVENIRVIFVLLQSLFETLEGFRDVTALHVDTRQLDPSLCIRSQESDGSFEIVLCAVHVTGEEP